MGTECDDCEKLKLRVDYLTRQYGFYTGHMNQVFNFFLVAMTILVGAIAQALVAQDTVPQIIPRSLAWLGMTTTVLFALLHWRSFQIAGALDEELKEIEGAFGAQFYRRRKATQTLLSLLKPITPPFLHKAMLAVATFLKPQLAPLINLLAEIVPPWLLRFFAFRNSTIFPLIYATFFAAFLFATCYLIGASNA